MKRMRPWFVLTAVIAFPAGFYLYHSGTADNQVSEMAPAIKPAATGNIGTRRPDFVLADIDGKRRHINEWQNHVIVLNFWATWCPPCLEEIPVFVELQKQYQARGLQFIGIALQEAEEIRSYSEAMKIPYPLLTGVNEVIEIAQDYGNEIGALPYTVIVDREGNIAFRKRGPLSKAEAEQVILSLL